MSRDLLIARHGETDWNLNGKWQGHTDVPLNVTGIQQAQSLAKNLKKVEIDAVYSSDLERARKTAEIVADYKGVSDIRIDRRLRERFLGTFEGLTSSQIRSSLGAQSKTLSIIDIGSNPSLEPWTGFISRIMEALEEIRDSETQGNALVVAHGGVMMALSVELMQEYEQSKRFKNGEMLHLSYDGMWHVTHSPEF